MARVLIVGGGCRGRRLAGSLAGTASAEEEEMNGANDRSRARVHHAVRMVTRTEAGRSAIEAVGAECLIGDPGRLATLHGALDGVTVVCWLLATAHGSPQEVRDLHGSRLAAFLGQTIDTPMRGFVYETSPACPATANGERVVVELAARNAIPVAFVRADPGDPDPWLARALAAVEFLLSPAPSVRGAEPRSVLRYPDDNSPKNRLRFIG